MSDVIKLLPDHIANQIAAGEVVQRPASVVKELVENSVDAGATKINLIVKDGGRSLVQVVDNGSGMSEIDARMSFERHATSKISSADDLFSLQTKGFRGEALASIAAVAHVCLKTKLHNSELGTEINIEGSKIVSQNPVSSANGTSIAVKNLFFNVPARRNFLGKDTTEYQKIIDEFLRIVLVHYEVEFSLHHNDDEIYFLPAVKSLRQRIVSVYGNKFNEKLVPVNEETDIIKITGFVTKPDVYRTNPDRCFFFVNHRYFKDRYFNHSVITAYEGLIPGGKYPPYFLYFEVPASSIDVNVHPTKTEIKFEDGQSIYQILRSSVKQALGANNIASTLDFEQETGFNIPMLKKGESVKIPEIKVNPDFNPFKSSSGDKQSNGFTKLQPSKDEWENFYGEPKRENSDFLLPEENEPDLTTVPSSIADNINIEQKKPFQLGGKYILTSVKNGFLLIDQYRAHCRILYDELILKVTSGNAKSQQLLFSEKFEIDTRENAIWKEFIPTLNDIGFDLKLIDNSIEIYAVPAELKDKNPIDVLNGLMDGFSLTEQKKTEVTEKLIARLVANTAIKGGTHLSTEEMQYIIDALFASSSPQVSPSGKKIIESFTLDEITKRFN